jgi:hypothetical protein
MGKRIEVMTEAGNSNSSSIQNSSSRSSAGQVRTDSATVRAAIVQSSRMGATFGNGFNGFGTGRDSTQFTEIVGARLTPYESIKLYQHCGLIRKIVDAYPMAANEKFADFTLGVKKYGFDSDKVDQYFEGLKSTRLFQPGGLRSRLVDASKGARAIKVAYLLLGVDDGQDWDQPINWDTIQSLRWVEVLPWDKVYPDLTRNLFKLTSASGTFAGTTTEGRSLNQLTIHPERLLVIGGNSLPSSLGDWWQYETVPYQSVIQPCVNALVRVYQSLAAVNIMLQDWSVFAYGLDGLAEGLGAKTPEERAETREILADRFASVQMSKSVLKGIMHDKERESVTWANRNATGVDPLLNQLQDAFVSEADVPRHRLMGASSRAGLGAEGRGIQDRMEWASLVSAWQQQNWHSHLMHLVKIALSAKDGPTGGRVPEGFGVQFPSILQLDPLEQATAAKTWGETFSGAITAGILTPLEVRESVYKPNEWPTVPNVNLDERFTDQLSEQLDDGLVADPAELQEPEPGELEDDDEDNDLLEPLLEAERLDGESMDALRMDGNRLFFFEQNGKKRRTGIVASSAAAARSKCRRGCGRLYKVRTLTASEEKTAHNGGWVRGTATGKPAGSDRHISGFGPKLKRKDSQTGISQTGG